MDEYVRALSFYGMTLLFQLRDLLTPPEHVLGEAGIEPGFRVLDYGCGPGSFSIAAAQLVGESGQVYAVDVYPLALRRVRRTASRKGLRNVETIETDCETGLEGGTIDVALLYDAYHDLADPGCVIGELHRVLKPRGILSFSDHHLGEQEISSGVAGTGLFQLSSRGERTYRFLKTE